MLRLRPIPAQERKRPPKHFPSRVLSSKAHGNASGREFLQEHGLETLSITIFFPVKGLGKGCGRVKKRIAPVGNAFHVFWKNI